MSSHRSTTQLPRHAPPSLSLRSLGAASPLVFKRALVRVSRKSSISFQSHALARPRFTSSPSAAVWRQPGFTLSPSRGSSVLVTSPVSTSRRFGSFLSPMHSADSPFWPVVVWAVYPNNATPNHALQRTAPRVTVAAILAWTRLVRSWRCPTSVAPFCAPPSQLPRHAPPSLSLGSLGR